MLFRLESGVVININQITAIEEREVKYCSGRLIKFEYLIYMTDKREWCATRNDYNALLDRMCN